MNIECLVNEDEVVNKAAQEGSGDRSLFSSALGFLGNHQVRIKIFVIV